MRRLHFWDKPNREDDRSIVFTFWEKYFLCEIGTKKQLCVMIK